MRCMRVLSGMFAGMWAGCLVWAAQAAPITVTDDDGRAVTLAQPARRIVSLAPHVTELLFAAGAGDRIVATVRHADYPAEAKALPRVGDAHLLDLERIAALKPDLLVVWLHGSAASQTERLRQLGVPMFYSEPRRLAQIGDDLRKLGRLTGSEASAEAAAVAFERDIAALRARYAARAPVRVFHQIWAQPLMTVNDRHVISDVIRLCGGVNVFGALAPLVPTVTLEAAVAARPQFISTGAVPSQPTDGLDPWRALRSVEPVARGHLLVIHGDLISRHTPRIAQGAQAMCEGIDKARNDLVPR